MSIESKKSVQGVSQELTRLEQVGLWIHEHPTTIKVLKVAGLVLGVALIASVALTAPILATSVVIGLGFTGALLTLASSVALFALDLIVPPHHDMKHHLFKPNQCEGGRLYYQGDVPVLSLDSDDPFKAGKAHGYLCGEAINRLSKRFDLVLHTLGGQPRADRLKRTLFAMRQIIPTEYLREMEGLVQGYDQWAQEQHWWQFSKKITVDDVLLLHLIPDSLNFQPGAFESALRKSSVETENRNISQSIAVGCSAVIERDSRTGFRFARNMDWPSFGLAGAYSLVINRKHTNGLLNTVEVGMPGFIGTLTGMNSEGLSLAMNVCSGGKTSALRGMPASFYNRSCLEKCRTVEDVKRFTHHQSPLGAYHLTVADRDQAESIHFYQSNQNTHLIRRWRKNQPLSTLNCRYSPEPNCAMHYSVERQKLIDAFFQDRNNRPLEEVLSLPYVNNWLTTHRVVMEPKTRSFRVAFDNAFAGKAPLHEVPSLRLLQTSTNN
ncbi:MAG: hypothetical protein K2P51_05885 [Rhabdochlamydiaceae bacterium]|nr:hypothetical protein [Rhabdochlamydiaceae bacterium]